MVDTKPSSSSLLRVHILGCGAAYGTPIWTGKDKDYLKFGPKDKRLRPSLWLTCAAHSVLIDASPDLRYQALRAQISHLDAVVITHKHTDHTAGLPELNLLSKVTHKPIPLYANKETLLDLDKRFGYAFQADPRSAHHHPSFLEAHEIEGIFSIGNLTFLPIEQDHGFITSLGFRVGQFAYSTDVVRLSESAFSSLEELDVWIVDCLQYGPSLTHSHLEQTLTWIDRVKPKRAILTHLSPEFQYEKLRRELPEGVEVAYDGLVIEIPYS